MRRTDREITNIEEIKNIIDKCDVCRIALFDSEYPYIVPLNFGYVHNENGIELYFHGANVGKKLLLMKQNNRVSFEMDCSHKLITGEKACDYTMEFESVIGFGKTEIVEDAEKIRALDALMKQYTDDSSFEYDINMVNAVVVFKIVVEQILGKRLKK